MRARHGAALALALLAPTGAALAQQAPAASADTAWRRCAALGSDNQARLACFDQWAGQQAWQAPAASASHRQTHRRPGPDGQDAQGDHGARLRRVRRC